ncbi:hypothetical protein J3459_010739 [Metarhizium acridum]|uniref:uncharacterized protein n=1 Tax=Metarhizium acridum TaxID=92637 RepID=UPI001C6C2CFB|nr:hypothetical protein J3458_019959 [Metarhizium acridum]KAG8422072.1 hypothetical protein J3459_010739 [Metarhizium acridum]
MITTGSGILIVCLEKVITCIPLSELIYNVAHRHGFALAASAVIQDTPSSASLTKPLETGVASKKHDQQLLRSPPYSSMIKWPWPYGSPSRLAARSDIDLKQACSSQGYFNAVAR